MYNLLNQLQNAFLSAAFAVMKIIFKDNKTKDII